MVEGYRSESGCGFLMADKARGSEIDQNADMEGQTDRPSTEGRSEATVHDLTF